MVAVMKNNHAYFLLFALITVTVTAMTDHQNLDNVSLNLSLNESHPGSNGSHVDEHHGEHHGIHVASINFDYVKQPLIVTLFMLTVVICKLGFHKIHWLSNYVPESCLLIILGVIVGLILHTTKVDTSSFYYIHPETFFLFLLPPCILEASYELHDTVFFHNLGTVLLYAVVGTLLNCFIIGPILYGLALAGAMGSLEISLVQCLVFSSLIVAVDPVAVLAIFQEIGVNSVLYFLVFGESLLNDAVTVVLYNTMKTLSVMEEIPPSEILLAFAAFFTVSLGGLSIGVIFGIITSFVTRWTQHVRVVEPLEVLAMAYGSYLMAELFHFSGIISMIGCGLVQVHYAFHNISQNSTTTVKYFTKMLSTTCDSIIFMFLGIALVRDDHDWNTGFVLCSVVLCLVTRFLVTISLTFFANYTYRQRKINAQEQFIMGYGGLRGAVAFCLVAMLDKHEIPQKFVFQTAVFVVILFTVFIQGISIKPLVYKLNIILEEDKVLSLYQEINDHVTIHALAGVEDIIGRYGHNKIKEFFIKVDDTLKAVLQRDPLTNDEVIMELYKEIAIQQYLESVWGPEGGDDSSQVMLYRPRPHDEVFDESTEKRPLVATSTIAVPFDPAILRRLEQMGVNDTVMSMQSRRSMPPIYDERYRTNPTTPEASDGNRKLRRFFSETDENAKDSSAAGMRRRRFTGKASQFIRKSLSGPDFPSREKDLSAKHLRKLLTKTSAANAFTRKTDRNLRNSEGTELVYQLHEKQRRHDRYIRSQSVFGGQTPVASMSRVESPSGSMGQLHVRDKSFMSDDAKNQKSDDGKVSSFPDLSSTNDASKNVEPPPRMRHRTEGAKGLSVYYVPKFVPRRAIRLNDQQRRYTVTDSDAQKTDDRISAERNRSSLPLSGATDDKNTADLAEPIAEFSADDKTAGASDPEECVILLTDEKAAAPPEVSHTQSMKGRGHLKRQDDLKFDV